MRTTQIPPIVAAPRTDGWEAFDEQRSAFKRELFDQLASSAGSPRATLVTSVDAAFARFSTGADGLLRAGSVGMGRLIPVPSTTNKG